MTKRTDPWRGWAAHQDFIHPARRKPQLWRLLVGMVVIAAIGLALNTAMARIVSALAPDFWLTRIATPDSAGTTPAALVLLLCTFAFFAIGTGVAVRLLHDRPALTLIGPVRAAWTQFRQVLIFVAMVGMVVLILPPYDSGLGLEPNLPVGTWVALLPLSLTALMIQVSAEEVLFRGYLQQQVAARFSQPWVWICVPSLIFAAGHYVPSESGD
ncbi:unnamed protein product, partial [Ectocarpus sp. 12 AP-2014]